jgi:hypothetical protein
MSESTAAPSPVARWAARSGSEIRVATAISRVPSPPGPVRRLTQACTTTFPKRSRKLYFVGSVVDQSTVLAFFS